MYINWKVSNAYKIIGGKIMKLAGKRSCMMMLSLFMSISMLFPIMTNVQANEQASHTTVKIAGTDYEVTYQCIDEKYAVLPCGENKTITIEPNEEYVTKIEVIEDYDFVEIEDNSLFTRIYAFRYDSIQKLQYKSDSTSAWSEWKDFTGNETTRIVKLKYKKHTVTDLPLIDGSDTTQDGITMNLFNYTAKNSGADNNINYNHLFKFVNYDGNIRDGKDWNLGGRLRQGIVSKKLVDGYPFSNFKDKYDNDSEDIGTYTNESLAYLFNPDIEHSGKVSYPNVNKLLRKTADGSYVYDSKENYAIFDEVKNEFVLSTAVAAPNIETEAFKFGNFFPFNKINSTDPIRYPYGSPLYTIKNPDYHFGLTMEATFLQPKDGIYQDQNMIFDFSGDDDVWVFIDDVLVLDLGGIHAAQSGSIDFASGNVTVNGKVTTTIKERFEKAKADETTGFEGNTFADFTEHSIKFFYLERGAGASNCKLKINLPIMPKDGFAVSKDVSNVNSAASIDDTFTFRAYVDTNNNGAYEDGELLRNVDYHIGNTTYQTAADGTFTLKAGELAEFKENWTENLSYKVEEINIDATRYQNVKMTVNNAVIGSYDEEQKIASSGSLTIGQHVLVAFDNVLRDDQVSSLQIQKKISEGISNDEFQMITKINGNLYKGVYTITDGTSTRSEIASNGVLTIKQNEIATIEKLPIDTSFEVVENLDQVNAEYQKYSTEVNYRFEQEQGYGVANPSVQDHIASGELTKETALLYVTNTPIYGNLKIIKNIDTANFANGDPIFTFKIERLNKNGETIETQYRSVRFDNTLDAQSITIEHIPLGEYRVSELSSLRYQVVGEASQKNTIKEADQTILFNFKNKVVNDQYYSHTDIMENHVEYKKDEQGNITDVIISQDTLETEKE